MVEKNKSKLLKLIGRYKKIIILWLIISLVLVGASLLIYYYQEPVDNSFEKHVAELLMTLGQAIIGVGLIGGGVGGVINFIFEQFKEDEDNIKRRLESIRESIERKKASRTKMLALLQNAHDNVELARVLIKSHQSGRTYGEQIRNRIIPSLITLKDFKRRLEFVEDSELEKNSTYLRVSLTYMVAYLNVLKEEFESNYLMISNLQKYKDAMVNKMTNVFTQLDEDTIQEMHNTDSKTNYLNKAEDLFKKSEVPPNLNVVWKALENLEYLKDFIGELMQENGVKSMYDTFFLQHFYHCNKILRIKESDVNSKIINRKNFQSNLKELNRIEEKKNSDTPLTNQDSLTRKIMEGELLFDFENKLKRSSKTE